VVSGSTASGDHSGYPYAKYGQAFVPEFPHLASEDAGCVLISERLLFRSRMTAAMDESRTETILHEMAHMCFGDLVTQQWWDCAHAHCHKVIYRT
jgi:aminopeptidase N